MASCEKCGKPIGLVEYTLGDSKQLGLCKSCRTSKKWCNDCICMLTITAKGSAVIRCIKYGYDLSDRKNWKTAVECQGYTAKIIDKNSERASVYLSSRK